MLSCTQPISKKLDDRVTYWWRGAVERRAVRRLLRVVAHPRLLYVVGAGLGATSAGRARGRAARRHRHGRLRRHRAPVRRRQLQLRLENTRPRSTRRQV